MKPFRIFVFFLLVCGLLLGISFVFPDEGLRIGREMKLRFVSASELFLPDSSVWSYTDSLVRHANVSEDPEWEFSFTKPGSYKAGRSYRTGDTTVADSFASVPSTVKLSATDHSPNDLLNSDSPAGRLSGAVPQAVPQAVPRDNVDQSAYLPGESATVIDSLVRLRLDSIRGRVHPLELSGRAATELARFFRTASGAIEKGKLVRILHYGDSQIENDRMTALLRYRFQKVFGGSGCGMVPAIPLYSGNPVFRERYSGSWTRYTGFGRRDSTLGHNNFGAMASFTAVPPAGEGTPPSLEFTFLPGKRASQFSALKLLLHSYAGSGMVSVHFNDTISDTVRAIRDGYQEVTFRPGVTPGKVRLEFGLKEGGRIYGIGFDPDAGVQVDNIAMRGSSGLEFSRFDRHLLDTMLTAMNPGMILMQFGGNVVPYIEHASAYKRFFKRELKFMKRLCPGVPIIVIGPADMSKKENGRFITWETLEPVRDALREAALESDCAFWDMYAAMGGRNSMQNFVLADPPLATPDYIHFTPRGANLMAGMFFDAVMLEYEKYGVKGHLH
jgi:lysophospholipase L1-like esterase